MRKSIVLFLAFCGLVACLSAQQASIPVKIEDVRGSQQYYGFILSNGTVVVKPIYIKAHEFSEGFAAVRDANYRWGFINTAGKKVFTLPKGVSEVGDFSEGLCWFRDSISDKVGFVDRTGKVVIRPQWNFAHSFRDGLAAVGDGRTLGKSFFQIGILKGYINHKGEMVLPMNISHDNYSHESFCCGRAVIEYDDKVMIIDTKGNELFGGKYRDATGFSEGLSSVALATNEPCNAGDGDKDLPPCNLHWSVIDTTGRVVIDNMEIWGFKEGIGLVTIGKNEYMFIDSTGKRLFERNFYDADYFSEGLAHVIEMDKTAGFINHQGEMVIRLPKGYRAYTTTGFKHGVATIYKNEKKGKYTDHNEQWIDRKGNTLWEIDYRSWFP